MSSSSLWWCRLFPDLGTQRRTANLFFLMGGFFYLPGSIWDVVTTTLSQQQGQEAVVADVSSSANTMLEVENGRTQEERVIFTFIWQCATICYLINGLLDTWGSWYFQTGFWDVGNSLLFATAASCELMYSLVETPPWLLFSTHLYVINASVTIYLRTRFCPNATLWVRLGDGLFLLGSSIDSCGWYLEYIWHVLGAVHLARLWLVSSVAWTTDALFYVIDDHLYLWQEQQQPEPSKPTEDKQIMYEDLEAPLGFSPRAKLMHQEMVISSPSSPAPKNQTNNNSNDPTEALMMVHRQDSGTSFV